jgi:hypothetical protein
MQSLLEARVVPAGFDALDIDNSVWLTLPAAETSEGLDFD